MLSEEKVILSQEKVILSQEKVKNQYSNADQM